MNPFRYVSDAVQTMPDDRVNEGICIVVDDLQHAYRRKTGVDKDTARQLFRPVLKAIDAVLASYDGMSLVYITSVWRRTGRYGLDRDSGHEALASARRAWLREKAEEWDKLPTPSFEG